MRISALTDKGLVRESNQDNCKFGHFSDGSAWVIVCDGMGGAAGGNIASDHCVDIVSKDITENFREDMGKNAIRDLLTGAVFRANKEIYRESRANKELRGMGTTVIVALAAGNAVHLASVGDSRAYLVSEYEVYQITKDHSVVQEMIDRGQLTERQAKIHPRKNIITRALGVSYNVDIDYFEVEMKEENSIFICTDGFSNYVAKNKILQIIKYTQFEDTAKQSVELANEAGGEDNITVAVIGR